MRKWSATMSLAVIAAGFLALVPNVASAANNNNYNNSNACNPCYDPCADPCCCGEVEIGVDFLYWKPCVDDLDYAAQQTEAGDPDTPRTFRYKCVTQGYEPGVRVYAKLPEFYCSWDLYGSYTHHSYSTTNKCRSCGASGDLWPVINHPISATATPFLQAKGNWDLNYQEWDVLFGHNLSCNPCYEFTPFWGVAGINLEQEFEARFFDCVAIHHITKWTSDYSGVGLRLGSHYEHRLSDCLSFFVDGHATLLAGGSKTKITFDDSDADEDPNLRFNDGDCCTIVPGYHIGLGFVYDTCFCDTEFQVRLGYEFLQWHNVPNHRTFVAGNDPNIAVASTANDRTLGYHGLLAGFAFSF